MFKYEGCDGSALVSGPALLGPAPPVIPAGGAVNMRSTDDISSADNILSVEIGAVNENRPPCVILVHFRVAVLGCLSDKLYIVMTYVVIASCRARTTYAVHIRVTYTVCVRYGQNT